MSSLSHLSDVVEQKTNTAGVRTPILEVDPEDGTEIVFKNRVPVGSAPGIPIYLDARDSNDDPLPVDSDLVFEAKMPGDNDYSTVSEVVGDISTYNNKTIQEQQNDDNIDSVKIELDGKSVNIRDVDSFRVSTNSSAQIDWSNSSFYFDRRGVEEKQKGE